MIVDMLLIIYCMVGAINLYLIFYWVEQFSKLLNPKDYGLIWVSRHLQMNKARWWRLFPVG